MGPLRLGTSIELWPLVAPFRITGHAWEQLEEAVELHLSLARRTNPAVRCAGVSLNTSRLGATETQAVLAALASRPHLPVAHPLRPGEEIEPLVDSCLA
jgi:uncharacterized NAD-dependent epimerase/dehydratase family protein